MMENKALCHFAIARRMQKEIFKNSHKMECNKVKMDFTGGINLTLTITLPRLPEISDKNWST